LIIVLQKNITSSLDVDKETISLAGKFDKLKAFQVFEDAGYLVYETQA